MRLCVVLARVLLFPRIWRRMILASGLAMLWQTALLSGEVVVAPLELLLAQARLSDTLFS